MTSRDATGDHANQNINKQRFHKRKGNKKYYEFRGKFEDMNGHTFTSHGKTSSSSQYSNTTEQLGRYASHTYTYGEDIQSLIQNLKDTKISTRRLETQQRNASGKKKLSSMSKDQEFINPTRRSSTL